MAAEAVQPLEVAVLGPVRARRGNVELDLGAARKRAVFAILAVRANQVVSRDELVDGVWGENPPSTVEGSLYTYVSALRRSLDPERSKWSGGEVLVSAGSGYLLRLERDRLDVEMFTSLREQAQNRWGAGDVGGAVETLSAALALWQGDAFSGLTGPFAESQRMRLGELRLATVERRAELMLARGAHPEVVAELTGLVRDHPLRERLRGLLMLALHRSGRQAEALDVYRETRNVLIDELGIEPGPALRQLHGQILAADPALDVTPAVSVRARAVPKTPVVVSPLRPPRPREFVARTEELARLEARVTALGQGRGCAVWVEGEPGIGKSGLLTVGLDGVEENGCQAVWGAGDELGRRFPLRVMFECLGVDARSPDPRRAELATALRDGVPKPGTWQASDPVLAAVDRLLALVDQLCADAPLVLVVDDLQWADEASLLVWHRLARATEQLPLLLVGACRPIPRRAELDQLRGRVLAGGGDVLALPPLDPGSVGELVGEILCAEPGPVLRQLSARAAGNPLYLREMIEALVRDEAVELAEGRADVADVTSLNVPATLASAVTRRLGFLTKDTKEVLRWAALLGIEFDLGDAAVLLGKSPSELVSPIEEASAAGVLIDVRHRFAFRHPLIRHALYEGMPAAVRVALHRQAAETLDAAGAPVERVAEQLIAVPTAADAWVVRWLVDNTNAVATRSPSVAIELLERAVSGDAIQDEAWEILTARLARLLFWLGREPESRARSVLANTRNRGRAAEMRWLLAYLDFRRGDVPAAIAALTQASLDATVPLHWRARHQALRAMIERCGLDDLRAAEATAREALELADEARDTFATAFALQDLWQVDSVRRNHAGALGYLEQALEAVVGEPDLVDLHLSLLDNKLFTLQNLDRLGDATATLDTAQDLATRRSLPGGLHVPAAVHYYWLGRWDDARVELAAVAEEGPEITFFGTRQRGPVLLLHGAAALIAGHRGDLAQIRLHLAAAERYPLATVADRENCDFLLVATALEAEQQGRPAEALDVFAPILDRDYAQMMLRHQWLPTVARLALAVGDHDRAAIAVQVCEHEAELEVVPARAWSAAHWCRGLVAGDAEPVLQAAAHYRQVGRRIELACALEDAAVLLAASGDVEQARRVFLEAMVVFAGLGAAWDIRRAEGRLREFGIRRANPLPEQSSASTGLGSLSALEVQIAELVAAGLANPEIGTRLTLSRRTVQMHVSRILQKLGVDSRLGVTRRLLTRPSGEHHSSDLTTIG